MSGGGSTPAGYTTTTRNTSPWAPQAQGLTSALGTAGNIFGALDSGTGMAQSAQDTAIQRDTLGKLVTQGTQGSDAFNAAQNQANATLNGQYLNAQNPAFQGVVDQISNAIRPSIDSQYEAAGRYGSGSRDNAFASALTNQVGQLAYQNYSNERGNQIKALAAEPSLQQTGLAGQAAAAGAGATLAGLPYQNVKNYLGTIQGNYGSDSSESTPYFTNPTANALGLAQGGLGLLSGVGGLGGLSSGTGLLGLVGGLGKSLGLTGTGSATDSFGTAGLGGRDFVGDPNFTFDNGVSGGGDAGGLFDTATSAFGDASFANGGLVTGGFFSG